MGSCRTAFSVLIEEQGDGSDPFDWPTQMDQNQAQQVWGLFREVFWVQKNGTASSFNSVTSYSSRPSKVRFTREIRAEPEPHFYTIKGPKLKALDQGLLLRNWKPSTGRLTHVHALAGSDPYEGAAALWARPSTDSGSLQEQRGPKWK